MLLFVPFAFLPPGLAAGTWVLLTVAVFILGVDMLYRSLDPGSNRWNRAIVAAAVLGYAPTVMTVIAGQITILLVGVLCVALSRSVQNAATLPLGLETAGTAVVNPLFLPLGAILLRDWRRLAWAVATIGAVVGIGLAIFGIDTHVAYLHALASGKGWNGPPPATTWHQLNYYPLFAFGAVTRWVIRVVVFSGVAVAAILSRHEESVEVDMDIFGLSAIAFVAVTPSLSIFALMALLPVFLFLLTRERLTGWQFSATIGSLLPIHSHPYVIAASVWLGPHFLGTSLTNVVLPLLQPAVWGIMLLGLVLGSRVLSL